MAKLLSVNGKIVLKIPFDTDFRCGGNIGAQ